MNVTYTAEDGGLVAWLNNQTASYSSSTVHVTLPSGNVARGAASLELPSGLNLILQGQGMAGARNTTLDLERKNLGVGGMLGDFGRIEFRNMRIRNVRPSLASAAARVLLMTLWLVCAGLCGAPAPAPMPADARAGRAVLSPHWWLLRVSCTVTTPCDPRLRSTASASWSVVGCVVARRGLYVALIVASLLQPNTPTTAGHMSAVVGLAGCCTSHAFNFCTGAVRASLTHPCRISPRAVWRMLHGCVLYFGALCRAPV